MSGTRSYFLVQGEYVDEGNWKYVIFSARRLVMKSFIPVRILTARPGEKRARTIAELDQLGERLIYEGWMVKMVFFLRERLR